MHLRDDLGGTKLFLFRPLVVVGIWFFGLGCFIFFSTRPSSRSFILLIFTYCGFRPCLIRYFCGDDGDDRLHI